MSEDRVLFLVDGLLLVRWEAVGVRALEQLAKFVVLDADELAEAEKILGKAVVDLTDEFVEHLAVTDEAVD